MTDSGCGVMNHCGAIARGGVRDMPCAFRCLFYGAFVSREEEEADEAEEAEEAASRRSIAPNRFQAGACSTSMSRNAAANRCNEATDPATL